MEWIAENTKDAEMLRRIDLSPLDAAHADANEPLDVAPLTTRSAGLTVRVAETGDRRATVHITTSCTKARQTLDASQDYVISLP